MKRAAAQIEALEQEQAEVKEINARMLEVSLTGIERMLTETLVAAIPAETQAQLRAKRLADASRKVRRESMRVNAEFAAIEQDPSAE